ncbi:hypothetical protein FQR65_LT07400 [Abscondita terminalis]|nr:hypothetical protein FQR65_LT07400 [Abscondita terminalis]
MEAAAKVYSAEEIKKLAPGYRGKPEKFNFEKTMANRANKANKPPDKKSKSAGPSTEVVTPPTRTSQPQKPTPQRNEQVLSEAIFGVDVSIFLINQREKFAVSTARLPLITREVYQSYVLDENQLDRLLAEQEMVYYATGLVWIRFLDIKAKQGRTVLTSAENDIRKVTQLDHFNVPQPLYIYLTQLGDLSDAVGNRTEIEVPSLPVTTIGGFGGYHAAAISEESHNLFEEVPCLGLAADAVMALQTVHQVADYHVKGPPGSKITHKNLCGASEHIVPPRDEIKRRLTEQGITATAFPEYFPNTRFNIRYMRQLSDIVGRITTFKVEKLNITNMTTDGGQPQIIQTHPIAQQQRCDRWIDIEVQARSVNVASTGNFGAAYIFGFQTFKEPGAGANITARNQSWSCVDTDPAAEVPWLMPDAWAETRNDRRTMPDGLANISDRSHSIVTSKAYISISPKELNIKWYDERHFTLKVRYFNMTSIDINFIVSHKDIAQVIPSNVVLNVTENRNYLFKVIAKAPGSTLIYVNTSSNLNVEDIFLEVIVYKQYALNTISMLVGWIYFVAWSFSCYPQIRFNYLRQSVTGIQIDYFAFSFLGIAFYALFNVTTYLVQEVRNEYQNRFPRSLIPIKINDLLFAFTGTAMSLITIGQFIKYEEKYNPSLSKLTVIILAVLLVAFSALFLLAAENIIVWLDFLNFCSYVCLATNLVRVIPQVYLNYLQKASIGFNINTVLLDIVGGIFSILQMILDAYNYNDWISFFGNFSKFGLGLSSLIFDSIIIFQYAVLYKHSSYELQCT